MKKAEHRRTDALESWCWKMLLRVSWTAGRSNHSILKEINPEYSLEGLMLKVKLQYFGHMMWRADSLEKTLLKKNWGQEEKGMTEDEIVVWHHWLNGHESELKDREAWLAAVHGVAKSWKQLSDWKTTTQKKIFATFVTDKGLVSLCIRAHLALWAGSQMLLDMDSGSSSPMQTTHLLTEAWQALAS